MDDVGKHRSPWKRLWTQHSFSIISYVSLSIVMLCVYHLFSDGDFSVLMTLGSLFNLFGFVLLVIKAVVTKRLTLVSLKTLQCYAVLLVARLTSILRYEGYLPYDRSGDFVYQVCEATTLVAVVGLIAALLTTHARSYDARKDRFGAGLGLDAVLPPAAGAALLAAPALLLALVLHPSLNNNWATDTAWAFALYLEAVAVVPQLFMFSSAMASAAAEVEPFEANFVFAIAAGRACQFVFWLSSFRELNDKYAAHYSRAYPGHLVVLSQVVNLLLLADYVYFYLSASRRREGFILPSSI